MRDYLIKFFNEFSYEKCDAEFLLSVYDKIINNNDAKVIFENALMLYENDINCDFKTILNSADAIADIIEIHKYTAELLICICLTKRLKNEYVLRNISYQIFHDTVLDLRYKLEECKLIKGVIGTFVAFWFDGWFNLKRFALGRLQFEITELGLQYKNFAPNTKVLGVHIPRSGEPLSVEACDESFQMAKRFFKNEFANGIIFTCCSWLLYPENERILSKKSNIYKFMNRFEIINFGDSETNGDLWRIFDSDEKNIKLLPRNTSLQNAYAEHLENGGKMGWGLGIIIM